MNARLDHAALLRGLLLNALYDAGGSMTYPALRDAIPFFLRRKLFGALVDQHNLGNVRRYRTGEPIELTASARAAIAAGRAYLAS